jgi:hypothetical protein
LTQPLQAQGDFGIIAGISNYQGDLASYNFQDGFKVRLGPVLGIHAGYEMNHKLQLRSDLIYTRLSGDDELNTKEATRSRNLDFFSPVLQLSAGCDWNIFGFSAPEGKAFTPYLTGAVSLFYMNPSTKYDGKKISLHPLGTEGQYLDDYPDQKPYNLVQPALQLGGGLKILNSHKIILAIEGLLSYTFTDYIDDVSTIYISYQELLAKAGPLTAALANRQGEYLNAEPVNVPTGSLRGNPKSKDYFGTITIRIGKPFDFGSKNFNIRHRKDAMNNCPKF